MKKKLGQVVCACLALMMVFTIFAAFPVSAAGEEIWQAPSGGLKANATVKAFDGITITAAEDNGTKKGASIDGITFTGGFQASHNGKVTKNDDGTFSMEGAAYKIETERAGEIGVALNLGATKNIKAASAADFGNPLVDYTNDTANAADIIVKFKVMPGTYFFWFGGTKPNIFGLTFKEIVSKPAKTGETVTVKAEPNEKGFLGNVHLDPLDVELSKNKDFTQSTFTMPDKDVTVYVDFVSKDIQKEVDAVPFDEIKGVNTSEKEVYDDLAPFDGWQTSIGYADVSWESSNEEVISISGEVNAKAVDTQVTFTAVFTYQDYPNLRLTKSFEIIVPADTDDEGAVKAAADALTLGDTSAVKKNLELPVKGRRNTTITWTSSNPEIVGTDGMVNPSFEQSNTVTLKAEITRGSAKAEKEFTIVVPKIVPIEFRRAAVSNADGDVVMALSDGCYLSHIVFVNSITNLTGSETITASVTTGGVTKTADFNVKESCAKAENQNGDETVIYVDKAALPVGADSKITLTAYNDNAKTEALPQGTYEYSQSVADGATIYVAGDSTACTYPATGGNNRFPQTGWAAVLGDYFSGVTVKDLALSGRSSLNFLTESNYNTIKNGIKPGDYFIIQFGHNDSKSGDDKHTDPLGDRFTDGAYKKNMTDNYVNVALDKGAYPILTTSISRRRTSDSSLEQYVNATKELGKELGLPVVDLYGKVVGYNNKVGVEKAKDIYNYVKAHDSRFLNVAAGEFTKSQYYAAGTTDDTHINYFGAQLISQWFCDELTRLGHSLTGKRNTHTMTEAEVPSYADATAAAAEAAAEPADAEQSGVVTVAAKPVEAVAAADGEYSVIYEFDDALGSVEIIVGDEPLPSDPPKPSESPLPKSYEITSAAFTDGGVKVDYTTGDGDAVIVVATYDNDTITAANIFDADKSGSQTLEYAKPESGETKVFIWDSRDNVAPLCEPYTIK